MGACDHKRHSIGGGSRGSLRHVSQGEPLNVPGHLAQDCAQDAYALPRPVLSLLRLPLNGWRLARAHDLNPWVFIAMSVVGYAVHSLVYMPWFQGQAWQLTLLILLRLIALVVPAYILIRGKGIALAFNASIAVMFAANTAWHVCYYVYF